MVHVRALAGTASASLIALAGGAAGWPDASTAARSASPDSFDPALTDLPRTPAASEPPPSSVIARIRSGSSIALRSGPGGAVLRQLGDRTEFGSRRALAVATRRGRWLGVRASELANGQLGWIDGRARAVVVASTLVRLEVDVSRRELRLHRGDTVVGRFPVSVGRAGSPTPTGRFAVTDKLPGARFSAVYGCCVLALTGRQTRLPAGWNGGDRLAIHGSPDDAVGGADSAGCVRARRGDLELLDADRPGRSAGGDSSVKGAGRRRWVLAPLLAGVLGLGFGGAGTHARAAPAPFFPNDATDGAGWASVQWNFAGAFGVGAPAAWANLIESGAPGGWGVIVAVLDTGVGTPGRSVRAGATDLATTRLVNGWDFVDNDADTSDENGHGTHIASTIVEETNNGIGLTGLAYGARVMPVRVIDRLGLGDRDAIARGIRYAADRGAKVINLSFAFGVDVTEAQLGSVLAAIDYAADQGALLVGPAGNDGAPSIGFPGRSEHVLAVGATTEFGCAAAYSNHGPGLDLVAPGGGADAAIEDERCRPGRRGRDIAQLTASGTVNASFGTSLAVPHVSATAALLIASGILGPNPTPERVATRLERTARDLGAPGYDERYGWGLVSADRATATTGRVSPIVPYARRNSGPE